VAERLLEEQRENWGSRAGFVLAAIGSAVGLGNLWGFPYKVYANGGGAFLIPYVLAMLLLGIPLLILEFSLGHMTQRAAPDSFRGINRKTEPIGWWGILLGFVIISYYPVILAWCGNYLVFCVQGIFEGGVLPWAGQGADGVTKAEEFFKSQYLNVWTAADNQKPWAFGRLVTPIAISLVVIWLAMYLCIFRGVKAVSKVVLWTVPLPWIMLLILTIRGLTLPGAVEGLNFYLQPKWALLAKPETWRWAFGQMFFSMSLAFGVMITYASFLHRKSDINNNATIIGLADVGTSFVAGVAVFATLGAMAFATRQAGLPVSVEKVVTGGPGLAFVAFPYALAQLPASAWFGAVFFIALLTLGIDSAFSITESILASLVDKTGWNRNWTLIGISAVGLSLGLVYCTRGGMTWVGAIDEFVNGPLGGITLLGLLEAVVVGWAYRIGRLREHANERSDWKIGRWWDCLIRYVAPVILSILFAWSLLEAISKPGGLVHLADGSVNLPAVVGLIVAVLVPLISLVLSALPSPGADTHAQHVGQIRYGRIAGIIGCILVLWAIIALVPAFRQTRQMRLAGLEKYAEVVPAYPLFGYTLPRPTILAGIAAIFALLAVVVGGRVVHRAERTERRPSGLARMAAGWGVMAFGAAGGVLLTLAVFLNPAKAAEAAVESASEVGGASYVVLTVMLTLLVVGLGWCFYRAVKAISLRNAPTPQRPESPQA